VQRTSLVRATVRGDMSEDWLARWREGRTAFHEGRPNALLERHVGRLAGRIFVPLCGKAEDLAFLAAQGHDVIGVDLAEQAVREFFAEHDVAPARSLRGPFTAYEAAPHGAHGPHGPHGSITLLAGDIFAVTPELLGPIDAVYDRAALIALPPELRPPYVALLRRLLPPRAPALVLILEYNQSEMTGPPFAVLEAELRTLYEGAAIEFLDQRPATSGKCAQLRAPATERCFAIRSSPPRS
jgi:thiopurine S-methyltransferase